MSLDRRELLRRAGAGALALAAPEGAALAAALEEADLAAAGPRIPRRAVRALRAAVRGPVLLPGTPGYGGARLVYNVRFDGARPRAVVQPVDPRDVQALVRWADRFGIRIVPRSGGHSYAGPDLPGLRRAYYGSNLARLREIKRTYDPDFRFRFRQAIPPA